MIITTQSEATNYQLLDSGDGKKLEKIGTNIIIRPDTNCVWKPKLSPAAWQKATAIFTKAKGWQKQKNFKEPWLFTYQHPVTKKSLVCDLHFSDSKNIGIFPEQSANWEWMSAIIAKQSHAPQVLNLFGYTGMATLAAAAAGAEVCHVDSSQSAITWARNNQQLSKLTAEPIRWIIDDCAKFLAREIKREKVYDAIIMDPPAFGRDQKGKVFEFEKHVYELLGLVKQVVRPKPLFFIFNGYSMGYSATVLQNLLLDFYPQAKIECGELQLKEADGVRNLPCSLFARFK